MKLTRDLYVVGGGSGGVRAARMEDPERTAAIGRVLQALVNATQVVLLEVQDRDVGLTVFLRLGHQARPPQE